MLTSPSCVHPYHILTPLSPLSDHHLHRLLTLHSPLTALPLHLQVIVRSFPLPLLLQALQLTPNLHIIVLRLLHLRLLLLLLLDPLLSPGLITLKKQFGPKQARMLNCLHI
uniref:Uncharacterized protein n=1 Tax=Cacopsylla melanoneura TaxID=428564 RepID=A0A8D8TFD8_9HEMI